MNSKKLARIMGLLNWYGPYLGAGIRLKYYNKSLRRFEVQMKMRWYNRNIFGTHFGGSLYAMCDPFFCFIVSNYLGREYIVWDKAAKIEFVKPGRGTVTAVFELDEAELAAIKIKVDSQPKHTFWVPCKVIGPEGEIVAEVEKELYVRKKKSV